MVMPNTKIKSSIVYNGYGERCITSPDDRQKTLEKDALNDSDARKCMLSSGTQKLWRLRMALAMLAVAYTTS
jgi:hypothetical protein